MTAYQAGAARVSSTVTKQNPRPRKYATASERQAAYRARAPEVCFRAEPKTVDKLDEIAQTIDQSRADLLLSMTKFALANHDWARFGLTHRPLPFGYGMAEQAPATNPAPIWKRKRPKSLGKPVPLTPKQKAAAKAMAKAAGRKYPNLVDNIAASRLENPTMKKPTPAQLAARAKFAEMARSGAFKRKGKKTTTRRKANPAPRGFVQADDYTVNVFNPYGMKPYDAVYMKTEGGAGEPVYDLTILKTYDKPTRYLAAHGSVIEPPRFTTAADAADFLNEWYARNRQPAARKTNPAKKTVSEKISQLVREGYPQKQAVAVALKEQRAGKVKRNPAKRSGWRVTLLVGDDEQGEPIYATFDTEEQGALLYAASRVNKGMVGEIVRVTPKGEKLAYWFDATGIHPAGSYGDRPIYTPRKPNPATGTKKSRTKLNPTSSSRFKYVCIAPLEYSGAKYGIDERTPVTLKFTKTEPAAHLVYACYELPSRLVQNDDFQNFAYHNKVIYMSLAELKMLLKGYMK